MKKQFSIFSIIIFTIVIFSPLPILASEYSELHCPEIIRVEDNLGNVGIGGISGSFLKGVVNTITVKITAVDPQQLTLHYQFLFCDILGVGVCDGTDWTTSNTATIDVTNAVLGPRHAWIRVDNQDEYGCIGAYYDTQAYLQYEIYPAETDCLSFTYSDWSSCSNTGQQTRSVISSSPNGCSGGNPILTQSCTYTPPTCTSFTYSDWTSCQPNGTETRTIISSSPSGCSGGNPMMLTMSCTYVQTDIPCVSYTYSNWDPCQPNNTQYRRLVSTYPTICVVGNNPSPIFTQSCTYTAPTCTSWTYSDWGICNSSGVQSRTILSTSPSGCTGGNPVLNKSCNYIPPCISDAWSCGDWGDCSANGSQARICTKTFDCPNVQTESPIINQPCEVPNQNLQIETQSNQAKNEPIPIKNNEQEAGQGKNITDSQVAEQRKSEVAKAVQEILQVAEKDTEIGQQIKTIAQTQVQNQEKLEVSLQKVQNRSELAKFFVGPNYEEINNVKKLLEQNREQIKQLNQVKNQLFDQDDQQKLTEQIQLFEQSNQEIENSLNISQKGFSLFGWLFRLFVK